MPIQLVDPCLTEQLKASSKNIGRLDGVKVLFSDKVAKDFGYFKDTDPCLEVIIIEESRHLQRQCIDDYRQIRYYD
jgi:hypothetical protein